MKYFVSIIDNSGTTFEQNVLGARGIGTVDPANIEAILYSQFHGGHDVNLSIETFRLISACRVWAGTPSHSIRRLAG
jgi:hypothetical protein